MEKGSGAQKRAEDQRFEAAILKVLRNQPQSRMKLKQIQQFKLCPKGADFDLAEWILKRPDVLELRHYESSGVEFVCIPDSTEQRQKKPQQQKAAPQSAPKMERQQRDGYTAAAAGAGAAGSERAVKGKRGAEGEPQANLAERGLAKSLKRRRKGAQKAFCEIDAGDQLEELIQDSSTSEIQFANLSQKQRQLVKAMAAALRLESAVESEPAAEGRETRLDVKVLVVRKTREHPGVVPVGGVQKTLDAVRRQRAENKAAINDAKKARTEAEAMGAAATAAAKSSKAAAAAATEAAGAPEGGEDDGVPKLRWVIDRNIGPAE